MYLKGLDNGYVYTKSIGYNERNMFKSAYSTKVIDCTSHINIDGTDYYVGSGNTISQPDKTDHEINKVCTLTNLAMTGNNDYFLVVGLPIAQFKQQKNKFIETILNYNKCDVTYYGKKMNINIKDVTAYPQGAAALFSLNCINGDFILFDFGGFTVDIAWIEMINGIPMIKRYDTWFKGISTLYSKIIEEINLRHNLILQTQSVEKILIRGLLTVKGKEVDIGYINTIFEDFLDEMFSDIEKIYPVNITDTYLLGGSSKILYPMFKKRYPHSVLMDDCQFANAQGFYKIGLQKYYRYISKIG